MLLLYRRVTRMEKIVLLWKSGDGGGRNVTREVESRSSGMKAALWGKVAFGSSEVDF